jgi:DNA-binding MarR family transcriptional regulator
MHDGVNYAGYASAMAKAARRETQGPTVPQALGRLRVAIDASYEAASRELGLTPQQAELLCEAMAPAAIGDLAEALHCDRSNISHLVDRASARGLVRRGRAEQDARVSLVELTPAGQRLARTFIATLEAQLEPLLAHWTRTRQSEVAASLGELAEALEAAASGHR